MSLKRKLRIVFDETTNGGHGGRRYIAKSLDGGTGWGVWDRKKERFLKDREVRAIPEEQVREMWAN